jgi:hypothetical protein
MYFKDNDVMLFNLSCSRHFPSKNSGMDIFCMNICGPYFDGGNLEELCAYEPFNGNEKCSSRGKKPGYAIPVDSAGKNMLTNK